MPNPRQDPAPIHPQTTSAPAPPVKQPLLERPGQGRAGFVDLPYLSNGTIGLVFTASGPIAVTLAVGAAGRLTHRPAYRLARLSDRMIGSGIVAGWNMDKTTA